MPFSPFVREAALVNSRRCCCICNEFVGLLTNVHHIIQEADGGANSLDNAIVLCLRCHGEVGHYNPHHPIGNRYSPSEVRRHRDNWWKWCETNPGVPPPKLPIKATPFSFNIARAPWSSMTNVTINNTSNDVMYDVWIKFSLELTNIGIDDIKIEDKASSNQIVATVGNMDVGCDSWLVSGIDASQKPAVLLLLHSVIPNQPITFGVSVRDPIVVATRPSVLANAVVSVASFSMQPEGRMTATRDAIARTLRWPEEGFSGSKIAFKVIRVHSP